MLSPLGGASKLLSSTGSLQPARSCLGKEESWGGLETQRVGWLLLAAAGAAALAWLVPERLKHLDGRGKRGWRERDEGRERSMFVLK